MRRVKAILVAVTLFMGVTASMGSLAAVSTHPSALVNPQPFDRLRHFTVRDAVANTEENDGYTEEPEYEALSIQPSDVPGFTYMAVSPYYKVFFRETTARMVIGEAWIEIELKQEMELKNDKKVKNKFFEKNSLFLSEVGEFMDLSYTVDISFMREVLILKKLKHLERIIQGISWEGITPNFEEDGSILFSDEHGKEIVKILPPFMEDAAGVVCTDVHYELLQTETGYELHKVIDEKGSKWLKKAAYPVIIDPTMQTFEDAWESSGLTPYGQYFKNLKEYVNPANGYLTVTQTDLVVPGRGLDLVIARVYQTPAVFYGSNPYDYESPPVTVGKGWQLDFPWVGSNYLHLWGGTLYKITWKNNQFENHKGAHFVLVKNGDSYTLTLANGTRYAFSSSGKLLSINDIDQNTIIFQYTDGKLTSITDTIGRIVTLSYSNNKLWKIVYNNAEIEYSYSSGCLQWMEDFLNRRTSYYHNTGYNNWLLSKIEYPTAGHTTYTYSRFSNSGYYRYYITHQRVYETNQVRHAAYSYTGSFSKITASVMTVKNESDTTKGSYYFTVNNELITQKVVKNASGAAIRKYTYIYNSKNEITEERVYYNGSALSYTTYYAYDNWGNTIYIKNANGHEQFFSYANTYPSGFFTDNTGSVILEFANAFSNSSVPATVHTALIGMAERQDATFVKEMYVTYDLKAHPTQYKNIFGNATTWLQFCGTFNEKTGDTSFPIDLTGHAVAGNGVLNIAGKQSDDTYGEKHSSSCGCPLRCIWFQGSWSGKYFIADWFHSLDEDGEVSIGPFTHYPGTRGYKGYSTNPPIGQGKWSYKLTVTAKWKAYPAQVKYNLDNSDWITVTSSLKNGAVKRTVPLSDGLHTLYFSESSSYKTKFSWCLYVPVDNSPDIYTTTMQYDSYGNVTSITDAESNTVSFTYASDYSSAYLTEISATAGTDTITTKAAYDYYRGWITLIQEPKGVAGSGYDTLYTYDFLGRVIKKEFPLLPGQSQRSYVEAVYDDTNKTVTIIDQLRHYVVQHYDNLGRLLDIKMYTGTYGSGVLYATTSYTYQYDDNVLTTTDTGNHTTTSSYDFLGRSTQIVYPDSTSVLYSYDDTNNQVTVTNGRGYDTVYWYDWLSRLTKVEQEYAPGLFAVTMYQYDDIGHLTSFSDAENRTTSYVYGSFFGLTKTVYPDSTYEECQYDDVGNMISFTDANGNETVYTYDDVYRLIHIQYQDQSTVSFMYDLNSNKIRMDDNAVNSGDYVEYSYDCWNRLITETRHISQSTYIVSYQYDVANRLANLTYPDNMQILYFYDDLNRMTEIKRYVDGVHDEVLMDNVQYNAESLLNQFDYGNDLRALFTYDSRDRPLTVDIIDGETSYLGLGYTYDSNSNITALINGWRDTNSNWHVETEMYGYDGLDRLISAGCISWSHTYSYDRVGNRTAKDDIIYTINMVNEVTALSDGTSFTYDLNGNRTQKTEGSDNEVYTYDYANRLEKVEKNSITLGEYVYGGDGQRIQVAENNVTTTYVYSGLNVLYEENSTGTAVYIYGSTGRLAKRTTINQETNTFYYHNDSLGSTRLVTDSNKNILSAATYYPFGETSIVEGSEYYLFNGKEKDTTGLYYFGARYYDPDVGRFITRDPLIGTFNSPQTLNRYTYCANNSLKYVDPLGLRFISEDEGNGYLSNRYSEENEEEVKWVGNRLDQYDYINSTLFLVTKIAKRRNVGVALGTFHSKRGFVVFTFDDKDEIRDILFTSLNELKKRYKKESVKIWLENNEIDSESFKYAIRTLKSEFRAKSQDISFEGFWRGAALTCVGLIICGICPLMTIPMAAVGISFGGAVAYDSIDYSRIAWILDDLEDYMEQDSPVSGFGAGYCGGGFGGGGGGGW